MADAAIAEIIAAGRRLAGRGLISAHSGNISCKVGPQAVLITAAGLDKGALTEQDILCIDRQGRPLKTAAGRRPSSESGLHLALYEAYPHIAAIVHAHPPYATALGLTGRPWDWQLLEEAALLLGPVAQVQRRPAGSAELAAAAVAAAAGVNALLLAGHGAVSWGESIEQALRRMEILEHTAQVMLLSRLLPDPQAPDWAGYN